MEVTIKMMRDPRYNSGSYISHREGMRSLRGSKSRKDHERDEMHRRALEEPDSPEGEEDNPVAQGEQTPVVEFSEPKKKRGRWWRFFIG